MFDELYDNVQQIKFPKGKRKNVCDDFYNYINFGLIRKRFKPVTDNIASGNVKYPMVYKSLCEIIEGFDFKFTSIILNKNVVCKKYTDKYNIGDSLTFSFGEFSGGELVYDGKIINTQNKPFIFNGKKDHYSLPFKGTRYSVVYFSHKYVLY